MFVSPYNFTRSASLFNISLCFPKLKNYRFKIANSPKLQLFSLYQFQQGFPLRVDAQLIKPIQRLTR